MSLSTKINLSEEIQKAESQLPMFLVTLGILGLALTAAVCGWWYTQNTLHQYAKVQFDRGVNETRLLIKERMETYIDALYGVQGLFAASKAVERDEWVAYIRKVNLKGRYPGVSAVRFIQRVSRETKRTFIEDVRGDVSLVPGGYPDFTIRPEGNRAEYFVMKYLEPYGDTPKMLGQDVSQDPVRKEAMERARDLGAPAATPRTFLDTLSGKEVGFLIFLPIYKNGAPTSTPEERRAALSGYVDGKFIAKDLFSNLFGPRGPSPGIDFEIFDSRALSIETLIYDENPARLDLEGTVKTGFHKIVTIDLAGRSWYLQFTAPPQFGLTTSQTQLPFALLAAGVIFSFLLALVFYALATSRYHALKLAEQMTGSLLESEERFRSLAQSAPEAIISADSQGNMIFWSRGAQRIFGYAEKEVLGKSLTLIMPERHREGHRKGLARLSTTGHPVLIGKTVEMDGLRKDGSEFPIELSLAMWTTAKGVFYSGIIRDVTERKHSEGALLQKTEELARANVEREQLEFFAYVASHDLQEPLQKIIAFGDLLEAKCHETLDPKGKDYVERMQRAAARMSQLVDDLLKFSRVKKKTEPLETVNLNDVVFQALQDLEVRIRETQGRVEYTRLATIKADRMEMQQLFQNLISNGLKFHRKEELPHILIRSRHLENGSVEIVFEDNGIGFNEKYAERIFKPFERLHGRGEYEGSGIGLAICQKIVLDHGGTIVAKSKLGKGSLFVVTLPSG